MKTTTKSFAKWVGAGKGGLPWSGAYGGFKSTPRTCHKARVRLEDVDIMIQPRLEEFSCMDSNHTFEMISIGYDAAVQALKDFDKKWPRSI